MQTNENCEQRSHSSNSPTNKGEGKGLNSQTGFPTILIVSLSFGMLDQLESNGV